MTGIITGTFNRIFRVGIIPLFALFILPAFFLNCSSPLWGTGKASKMKCIYFLPDSVRIKYTCKRDKEKIYSVTMVEKGKPAPGRFEFKKEFSPAVAEYTFPFNRDSIKNKTLELYIRIEGSHWREGYTIYIKPADFLGNKKVYCYYSPM